MGFICREGVGKQGHANTRAALPAEQRQGHFTVVFINKIAFAESATRQYLDGIGAGQGDLGQQYSFRSQLPRFFGESAEAILAGLNGAVPEWGEDVFTGVIMNITASRVASRFDLGGANYTLDAACASAMASAMPCG